MAGLCFPCAFNCYEAIKSGQECCFQKKDEKQETVWRQETVFIMEPSRWVGPNLTNQMKPAETVTAQPGQASSVWICTP